MSFTSDFYGHLKKKKKEEEEKLTSSPVKSSTEKSSPTKKSSGNSFTEQFYTALRSHEDQNDIAPYQSQGSALDIYNRFGTKQNTTNSLTDIAPTVNGNQSGNSPLGLFTTAKKAEKENTELQAFKDKIREREAKKVEALLPSVNNDFIKKYIEDVQKYDQDSQAEEVSAGNFKDFLERHSQTTKDLKTRGEAIQLYFEKNPNAYQKELVDIVATAHNSVLQKRKSLKQVTDDVLSENKHTFKFAPGAQRTWFKSSEGNVGEAILGTTADIFTDLGTGLVGMGEAAVDALVAVAPYITQGQYYANGGGYNIQADQAFNDAVGTMKAESEKFVEKDLYDEEAVSKQIIGSIASGFNVTGQKQDVMDYLDNEMEGHSVLGEKSDALVQSAGALGGQMISNAVLPGSGMVLMGTTAFGSEAENALKNGATMDEAAFSGLVSAVAEVGTELIGGTSFGHQTLIDKAFKKLSRPMKSKLAKTLVKTGKITVDGLVEGGEEALTGLIGAIGQKLSYMEEKEIYELFSREDALESFIGGLVLGGGSSVGGAIKSSIKGVDYVTGLTKNEQAVVDKIYEDRVAEAEKKGEVSKKDKSEIYDKVLEDLEKGGLDTDKIEEVLGGDSYKTYKDTIDSEDAQIKQLEEQLKELEDAPNTVGNSKKYDTLQSQLEELKKNSQRDRLKAQLSKDVYELSKSDKLVESYFEKVRAKQKFEADLNQYTGKAKDVIKQVMDSGLADNTNKSHEFWDMVANLASKRNKNISIASNEDILKMIKAEHEELGIEFDESKFNGQTIDGYASKNGIVLNAETKRALNFVVGHEIMHTLEGNNRYKDLQKMLLEYDNAEYESRYNERAGQYANKFDDKVKDMVDREVTADLVGDLLFTDKDFVVHLAKNRNVFQKVWDEIKYLAKMATAGSEQARQLEKIKHEFKKAWDEASKAQNNTAISGVKYSITEPFTDSNGNRFENAVLLDTEFFNGTSPRNWGEKLRTLVNERSSKNPFILPVMDENGNTTMLQFASPTDRVKKDGGANHRVLDELSMTTDNISKLAVVHIDEIVSVSEESLPYHTDENSHQWLDKNGWLHRNANVINQKNGNIYNLTIDIAKAADGRTILYATDGKIKKVGNAEVNSLKIKGSGQDSNSDTNVAQNGENVKPSLSDIGREYKPHGKWNVYAKDIMLNKGDAPVQETAPVIEKPVSESVAPVTDMLPDNAQMGVPIEDLAPTYDVEGKKGVPDGQQSFLPDEGEQKKLTRSELHKGIVDDIKSTFSTSGYDFDKVLRKAKNLSTFSTVDNTPQRVMEKALGYKEGGVLADLTVNKVAQNETEGIKWLNSFTDRKNGLLAKISKQYNIKPGSKESAAAQMYAEGFYVDENNDIIQYGDAELAKDFPNATVQKNIKGLAGDSRIRQIYDDTLAMINESRTRNAYPEIPRLDNYFLHFRAMEDTFSKLGLPFNPNDIRAKDLPTDLNGVTADLKPGQPYFASAMHRTGKRTSFDLLGGLERYLSSAKNQIYHIDDIQTLRALRNYIADTYGQANGLEGLDALSEEEAQDRIEKVYNSHLSTFAKFLNEEANILAGKTALIDRGLEGIIGRRGMTFLDTVNKQVGSNMVGMNVSSSLTNFLPVVQTFAKTNKFDFTKAFAQTVANKVGSVFGKTDGFAESSPVIIRRKGADRFYRTPWQKAGDAGYVFMSAVDDISTELIARTKYNELTRKGMDSQQAHFETDKWVSRLMGDRSLGQMPQLYNSKMLGLFTKFQLEVRNQLDSQFYDTIQEAKVSNEDIENGLARNAKTAAKVGSTFFQLAVAQHLFGKAFESVAGYNPSFDIISVLLTAFGFDDDEESEDTALDNIEQGFLELLGDLPYTSTLTGGRIPISSALPVEQFITGKDQYGNEMSRWDTLKEVAPYYALPGGYGQIKKTAQGLDMFSEDHPIAGSYTDSGKLRFPVEDTIGNRVQAGIFGQWASENARDYFDNERKALTEEQVQEFIDLDVPIQDYWEYREGLSGLNTLAEKADYIMGLDLPLEKKNLLINNLSDREDPIDLEGYEEYGSFEDFDFAQKYPEKYDFLKEHNISVSEYNSFDEETKSAYTWASKNPEKYVLSQAVSDDFLTYYKYKGELNDIRADKDSNGDTIVGSAKEKKLDYINNLDLEYGQKIVLFKSLYNADDTYNYEIIDYLNSREDIDYKEMETILKELGFDVSSDGTITWD